MVIIVSTSGDTGPAAIHATKGRESIDTFVLYPEGMISRRQALQMTTVSDRNIHVFGVRGKTSDDLDTVRLVVHPAMRTVLTRVQVVKNINNDLGFKSKYSITTINSFNWARVMLQIAQYDYLLLLLDSLECD